MIHEVQVVSNTLHDRPCSYSNLIKEQIVGYDYWIKSLMRNSIDMVVMSDK